MTDTALSHMCKRYNEQDKEIKNLRSDLETFMNLCFKPLVLLVAEQRKEIAELKTLISFERVQQQAEVNQLNDDIKFLRSKLPNL